VLCLVIRGVIRLVVLLVYLIPLQVRCVEFFGTWFGTFACWQRSCLVVRCMSFFESVSSWWVDVIVYVWGFYISDWFILVDF